MDKLFRGVNNYNETNNDQHESYNEDENDVDDNLYDKRDTSDDSFIVDDDRSVDDFDEDRRRNDDFDDDDYDFLFGAPKEEKPEEKVKRRVKDLEKLLTSRAGAYEEFEGTEDEIRYTLEDLSYYYDHRIALESEILSLFSGLVRREHISHTNNHVNNHEDKDEDKDIHNTQESDVSKFKPENRKVNKLLKKLMKQTFRDRVPEGRFGKYSKSRDISSASGNNDGRTGFDGHDNILMSIDSEALANLRDINTLLHRERRGDYEEMEGVSLYKYPRCASVYIFSQNFIPSFIIPLCSILGRGSLNEEIDLDSLVNELIYFFYQITQPPSENWYNYWVTAQNVYKIINIQMLHYLKDPSKDANKENFTKDEETNKNVMKELKYRTRVIDDYINGLRKMRSNLENSEIWSLIGEFRLKLEHFKHNGYISKEDLEELNGLKEEQQKLSDERDNLIREQEMMDEMEDEEEEGRLNRLRKDKNVALQNKRRIREIRNELYEVTSKINEANKKVEASKSKSEFHMQTVRFLISQVLTINSNMGMLYILNEYGLLTVIRQELLQLFNSVRKSIVPVTYTSVDEDQNNNSENGNLEKNEKNKNGGIDKQFMGEQQMMEEEKEEYEYYPSYLTQVERNNVWQYMRIVYNILSGVDISMLIEGYTNSSTRRDGSNNNNYNSNYNNNYNNLNSSSNFNFNSNFNSSNNTNNNSQSSNFNTGYDTDRATPSISLNTSLNANFNVLSSTIVKNLNWNNLNTNLSNINSLNTSFVRNGKTVVIEDVHLAKYEQFLAGREGLEMNYLTEVYRMNPGLCDKYKNRLFTYDIRNANYNQKNSYHYIFRFLDPLNNSYSYSYYNTNNNNYVHKDDKDREHLQNELNLLVGINNNFEHISLTSNVNKDGELNESGKKQIDYELILLLLLCCYDINREVEEEYYEPFDRIVLFSIKSFVIKYYSLLYIYQNRKEARLAKELRESRESTFSSREWKPEMDDEEYEKYERDLVLNMKGNLGRENEKERNMNGNLGNNTERREREDKDSMNRENKEKDNEKNKNGSMEMNELRGFKDLIEYGESKEFRESREISKESKEFREFREEMNKEKNKEKEDKEGSRDTSRGFGGSKIPKSFLFLAIKRYISDDNIFTKLLLGYLNQLIKKFNYQNNQIIIQLIQNTFIELSFIQSFHTNNRLNESREDKEREGDGNYENGMDGMDNNTENGNPEKNRDMNDEDREHEFMEEEYINNICKELFVVYIQNNIRLMIYNILKNYKISYTKVLFLSSLRLALLLEQIMKKIGNIEFVPITGYMSNEKLLGKDLEDELWDDEEEEGDEQWKPNNKKKVRVDLRNIFNSKNNNFVRNDIIRNGRIVHNALLLLTYRNKRGNEVLLNFLEKVPKALLYDIKYFLLIHSYLSTPNNNTNIKKTNSTSTESINGFSKFGSYNRLREEQGNVLKRQMSGKEIKLFVEVVESFFDKWLLEDNKALVLELFYNKNISSTLASTGRVNYNINTKYYIDPIEQNDYMNCPIVQGVLEQDHEDIIDIMNNLSINKEEQKVERHTKIDDELLLHYYYRFKYMNEDVTKYLSDLLNIPTKQIEKRLDNLLNERNNLNAGTALSKDLVRDNQDRQKKDGKDGTIGGKHQKSSSKDKDQSKSKNKDKNDRENKNRDKDKNKNKNKNKDPLSKSLSKLYKEYKEDLVDVIKELHDNIAESVEMFKLGGSQVEVIEPIQLTENVKNSQDYQVILEDLNVDSSKNELRGIKGIEAKLILLNQFIKNPAALLELVDEEDEEEFLENSRRQNEMERNRRMGGMDDDDEYDLENDYDEEEIDVYHVTSKDIIKVLIQIKSLYLNYINDEEGFWLGSQAMEEDERLSQRENEKNRILEEEMKEFNELISICYDVINNSDKSYMRYYFNFRINLKKFIDQNYPDENGINLDIQIDKEEQREQDDGDLYDKSKETENKEEGRNLKEMMDELNKVVEKEINEDKENTERENDKETEDEKLEKDKELDIIDLTEESSGKGESQSLEEYMRNLGESTENEVIMVDEERGDENMHIEKESEENRDYENGMDRENGNPEKNKENKEKEHVDSNNENISSKYQKTSKSKAERQLEELVRKREQLVKKLLRYCNINFEDNMLKSTDNKISTETIKNRLNIIKSLCQLSKEQLENIYNKQILQDEQSKSFSQMNDDDIETEDTFRYYDDEDEEEKMYDYNEFEFKKGKGSSRKSDVGDNDQENDVDDNLYDKSKESSKEGVGSSSDKSKNKTNLKVKLKVLKKGLNKDVNKEKKKRKLKKTQVDEDGEKMDKENKKDKEHEFMEEEYEDDEKHKQYYEEEEDFLENIRRQNETYKMGKRKEKQQQVVSKHVDYRKLIGVKVVDGSDESLKKVEQEYMKDFRSFKKIPDIIIDIHNKSLELAKNHKLSNNLTYNKLVRLTSTL